LSGSFALTEKQLEVPEEFFYRLQVVWPPNLSEEFPISNFGFPDFERAIVLKFAIPNPNAQIRKI
jgi:hypothetical protein